MCHAKMTRDKVNSMLVSCTGLIYWTLILKYFACHVARASAADDVHRKLSEDVGPNVVGILLAMFVGALANAAGVGGGAFFVPLFNLLLKFSTETNPLKPQNVSLKLICYPAV